MKQDGVATDRETFGPGFSLSPQQRAQVAETLKMKRQEKTVPLEHAIVLVKHLLKAQTVNMELDNHIKELQA